MTFDKKEHKDAVLELIHKAQFIGGAARQVVDLMDAVERATITPPSTETKKA